MSCQRSGVRSQSRSSGKLLRRIHLPLVCQLLPSAMCQLPISLTMKNQFDTTLIIPSCQINSQLASSKQIRKIEASSTNRSRCDKSEIPCQGSQQVLEAKISAPRSPRSILVRQTTWQVQEQASTQTSRPRNTIKALVAEECDEYDSFEYDDDDDDDSEDEYAAITIAVTDDDDQLHQLCAVTAREFQGLTAALTKRYCLGYCCDQHRHRIPDFANKTEVVDPFFGKIPPKLTFSPMVWGQCCLDTGATNHMLTRNMLDQVLLRPFVVPS